MLRVTLFAVGCLVALAAGWLPPALAQVPLDVVPAGAVFSSGHFLLALVAGLIMAIAFQLLLTNLAVATVLSPGDSSSDDDSFGEKTQKIETKVGLGLMVSVSIALFAACFLAVKLSLVGSPLLGAITAITIWAAFFFSLVWLSSTAIGSLLGTLFKMATSGLQGIVGTATAAIGANAAKSQAVSTAEDIAAAVRREFGFDLESAQGMLRTSLGNLQGSNLDLSNVSSQFEKMLRDADLQGISDENLRNVDRQTFVDLVSSRTDLSKQEVDRVADQLEEVWKRVTRKNQSPQSQLISLLQSVGSPDVRAEDLTSRLDQMLRQNASPGSGQSPVNQALQFGMGLLMSRVMQNNSLSDVNKDEISDRLQQFKAKAGEQLSNLTGRSRSYSVIQSDLEDYLLFSPPWKLNRETVKQEFGNVIYDSEAAPSIVRHELAKIDRNYFVQVLSLREDLQSETIQELADQLESIKLQVFSSLEGIEDPPTQNLPAQMTDEAKAKYAQTTTAIADYLRRTHLEELSPEGIQRDLSTLLDDPKSGATALRDRLAQVDRETLVRLLSQSGELSEEQVNRSIDRVQSVIQNIVRSPRRFASRTQQRVVDFETNLETYLRNTQKEELNPEGIKRDLQTLLQHPREGLSSLGDRAARVDRSTLVALLSQRSDISEAEANRIADQVESTYYALVNQIQKVQRTVISAIDTVFAKLRDYLNSLERPELNYEGIQRDFRRLFADPEAGVEALKQRLSHFDRQTLVALISSRRDISEADANRLIDRLESTRDSILGQAERVQQETQRRIREAKEQARRQAIATQKMAAGAAWWLFGTGAVSLAAAAIAGMLAITRPVIL
jgi:hypothetical protein